jgi:hypothetical protein
LDAFSVKIHQLSLTSFLEISKFIWIMKTFGCNLSADAFTRFFELVIVPDVIKVDDGQFNEAHYACCTFNTRRQNTRMGITRIQIAPCCKTNLTKDWSSYWFYVKVDMSTISGYEGPAHPLSTPIGALTAVNMQSIITGLLESEAAKIHFILLVPSSEVAILSKNLLLPESGRSLTAGPRTRSRTSMLTRQHRRFLSRSLVINWETARAPTTSCSTWRRELIS